MGPLKRRSFSWCLARKRASPGCRTVRHEVSQPQHRDELHVDCVREPGMRGAQPFRAPRRRRISLLLCNGRLPANDDGQRGGNAPKSLTCASPLLDSRCHLATFAVSLAKRLEAEDLRQDDLKHDV